VLLCEADGKALLARHGIAVPRGRALYDGAVAGTMPADIVVKAQMLSGGRGRDGLVSVGAPDAATAARAIQARLVAQGHQPVVMVEERLDIAAEYYLALRIDDVAQCVELLFSPHGGIDVEQAAEPPCRMRLDPAARTIASALLPTLHAAGVQGVVLGRLARLAADLHRVMVAEDADLIEINPLAETRDGRLVALDAKVSLDDNALFRHQDRGFGLSERLHRGMQTAAENEAAASGCTCVEMDGDIVMVTAGAGLGMLTVDLLASAGFRAACFFDNAANARDDSTETRLRLAFDMAQRPQVRGILFYQMLATRDLRPRVEALVRLLQEAPPPKPFYFGLSASYTAERTMTAAAGRALVSECGYVAGETLEELVDHMQADSDAGRL
jgi:succinyl-CoA synthetase beta subunit